MLTQFVKACHREIISQPPVWLMRQAGRHLPEYRALRDQHDFLEMLTTEELIVEVSLQPWRRYQTDAVIVFSDILLLPKVMGMNLMFLEGQGPKFRKLIANEEDLKALKKFEAERDIPFLTGALKKIKKEIGDRAALIGFAGSPWTVASYMLKDPSTRSGYLLKSCLERLVQETVPYLQAQIEAGAEAIQIFDSWGGNLKAKEYAEWSGSYIKEIVQALRPSGVPCILYIKNSRHLLKEMLAAGPDVISVGWETPLEETKKAAEGKAAIQGNFNPHILMQSKPETIAQETQKMLETMKGYPGYIANLGHGVLPKTPVENVKAFVDTVQQS
ncbi:MAG: uroporphyrinogen decarboxylase [Deltaproteobacteria bacterium]|nr:uroporphyrinogen decarboxylase [Deltaproteobacteria bacterium]MBI4224429.1 uroporphyrinogen decarboxylase [Deltaproteobacteria bacterium]